MTDVVVAGFVVPVPVPNDPFVSVPFGDDSSTTSITRRLPPPSLANVTVIVAVPAGTLCATHVEEVLRPPLSALFNATCANDAPFQEIDVTAPSIALLLPVQTTTLDPAAAVTDRVIVLPPPAEDALPRAVRVIAIYLSQRLLSPPAPAVHTRYDFRVSPSCVEVR